MDLVSRGPLVRTRNAFSRLKGENSTKYSKRKPCLCLWANLASESPFRKHRQGLSHRPPKPPVSAGQEELPDGTTSSPTRAALWPRSPVGRLEVGVPLKRLEGAHGGGRGAGRPANSACAALHAVSTTVPLMLIYEQEDADRQPAMGCAALSWRMYSAQQGIISEAPLAISLS